MQIRDDEARFLTFVQKNPDTWADKPVSQIAFAASLSQDRVQSLKRKWAGVAHPATIALLLKKWEQRLQKRADNGTLHGEFVPDAEAPAAQPADTETSEESS